MKWIKKLFAPKSVWVVRFHVPPSIVSRVFYDEDTKNRYIEIMAKWGYATIMDEEVQTLVNYNGD